MRISDQFPSDYLRAADFETDTVLTMSSVSLEEIGAGKEKKPVLYFKDVEKGLILNKTNASTISELYGDDTSEWIDEAITLFAATTSYQGKTVPCVRVKAPSRKKTAAAASSGSQKKISASSVEDDNIPF
jgi:hypothetical protein